MGQCQSRGKEEVPFDHLDSQLFRVIDYLVQNEEARRELVPLLTQCIEAGSSAPLLSAKPVIPAQNSCLIRQLTLEGVATEHILDQQVSGAPHGSKTRFRSLLQNYHGHRVSSRAKLSNVVEDLHNKKLLKKEDVHASEDGMITPDDWRYFVVQAERNIAEKSRNDANNTSLPSVDEGESLGHLYSFLPKVIKHLIVQNFITVDDFLHTQTTDFNPNISSFDAVVVFADASGFTKMTERLAKQSNGAEKIGACLNGFFRPVIETADMYGADILKFSGDALTMIWPASEVTNGETRSNLSTMNRAVCTALECCNALHRRVATVEKPKDLDSNMSLHIGVGCGKISVLQVGGMLNRWEYLIMGKPLDQISLAEPLATLRETVISAEVAEVLSNSAQKYDRWDLIPVDDGCYRVEWRSLEPVFLIPPILFDSSHVNRTADTVGQEWHAINPRLLGRFIPFACWRVYYRQKVKKPGKKRRRSVVSQVDINRISKTSDAIRDSKLSSESSLSISVEEESYLEEMRLASVVFINVEGVDPNSPDSGTIIQTIVGMVQQAAYSQEGSLNKCLLDDKGFLMLCCFGLPPLNHVKDDALRATLFSLRVMETFHEVDGLTARAGITTGLIWCGVVGSTIRREYTVLGDVVNLSARLMSNSGPNEVGVCDNTYRECRRVLEFKEPRMITVKGKEHPLKVWTPTGSLFKGEHEDQMKHFVMSESCTLNLSDRVDAIMTEAAKNEGLVTISGEAGCGKGAAAELVTLWAKKHNYAVLRGDNLVPGCTFTAPLHSWRSICTTMISLVEQDELWKQRVQHKQRMQQRTGTKRKTSVRELYQLLCCMLEQNTGEGDHTSLIPWLPLAAMILPSLEFGAEIVQAMRDVDLEYSQNSRFGELISALLEAFTQEPPAPYIGTVVMCRHHRGSSFFEFPNPHARGIVDRIGDFASRWNQSGRVERNPFVFVFISREGEQHQDLLNRSKQVGMNLEMCDLNREQAERYIAEYFASCHQNQSEFPHNDLSEKLLHELPVYLYEHIMLLTNGNARSLEIQCQHYLEKKMIELKKTDSTLVQVASKEALDDLDIPLELYSICVAMFERLTCDEQIIVKTATMYDDEKFSSNDLFILIPSLTAVEVSSICETLADKGIFQEIQQAAKSHVIHRNNPRRSFSGVDRSTLADAHHAGTITWVTYTMRSAVLKRVANSLVLQSRQHKSKMDISLIREMRSQLSTWTTVMKTGKITRSHSSERASGKSHRFDKIRSTVEKMKLGRKRVSETSTAASVTFADESRETHASIDPGVRRPWSQQINFTSVE